MNEKQRKLYKLVLKIALTYRLSLENICILLGRRPTEENKQEIKEIFDLLFGDNYNLKKCYTVLFEYETYKEPDIISNTSLILAMSFFTKYKNACNNKDTETLKKLTEQLNELDNKIKKIKFRDKYTPLTKEDYETICKYRVKYSISQHKISSDLNIKRDTLRVFETRIKNNRLRYKIDKLTDYYLDIKSKAGKTL